MRLTIKLFNIGFRQIFKDGILLVLLLAPFLMGAALRGLLPFAEGMLINQFRFSLQPWYPIIDAFLLTMTPIMTGMVCAFLMLDERDENIGAYYTVTPAGGRFYLAARLGLPMIWAAVASVLIIQMFGLAITNMQLLLAVTLVGILQGVVSCMLMVVLADNKVEGLALSKLSSFFVLALPGPWLINEPYHYLLGFLPSFWIGKMIHSAVGVNNSPGLLVLLFMGVISSLMWIWVLIRAFLRRTR